jgi:SAM-dependent methyltransferase
MRYDPIKSTLGRVFNTNPRLRIFFYALLDLLLLRTWHVRKELRAWAAEHPGRIEVLDAGMGFGQYSFRMARKYPGWHITGVDVKAEQVDDCRAFFKKAGLSNVDFFVADLEKFNRAEAYNLILSVDVMEHIPDDDAVFRNLCRALKPGGMLLISTPSDQGGSDVHHHDEAYNNDGSRSFIGEHVRDGYNIIGIADQLKTAGFADVEARYTYGRPGKLSWKLSMKYPILMLNTGKVFFILLPFYYLLTFPFALLLNALDVSLSHTTGTGLLVKARKQ